MRSRILWLFVIVTALSLVTWRLVAGYQRDGSHGLAMALYLLPTDVLTVFTLSYGLIMAVAIVVGNFVYAICGLVLLVMFIGRLRRGIRRHLLTWRARLIGRSDQARVCSVVRDELGVRDHVSVEIERDGALVELAPGRNLVVGQRIRVRHRPPDPNFAYHLDRTPAGLLRLALTELFFLGLYAVACYLAVLIGLAVYRHVAS